jgi:sugar lactone lactonase YvrE
LEWKCGATNGKVVAGGNGKGNETNQLSGPVGVIVDKQRDCLIICDQGNRRVVQWPLQNGTSGKTIISNIDCARSTLDNNEYLYVSDWKKDEVRRWKMNDIDGILVAGGNGKGNNLNQLNCTTSIVLDAEHSLYMSDLDNHRVMKWMEGAKEGVVVAGGQGKGNDLTQMPRPCGLIIDPLGTIYVADRNNHRIMCWPKRAKQGNIVVGENGQGEQANQLNGPTDLSFDRQGNLYVVDRENDRVQRFNIDRS